MAKKKVIDIQDRFRAHLTWSERAIVELKEGMEHVKAGRKSKARACLKRASDLVAKAMGLEGK